MNAPNPQMDSFRMHDEMGVPLRVSVCLGKENNIPVNLAAFACDAMFAGWTDDKVARTIAEACSDNGIVFKKDEFWTKIFQLWKLAGKKGNPECWKAMKEFIVDTPSRVGKKRSYEKG